MTDHTLKWLLVSRPDENGRADLQFTSADGGKVTIEMDGDAAGAVAHMVIAEMMDEQYDEDQGEYVQ
jgi:hypothetical protein